MTIGPKELLKILINNQVISQQQAEQFELESLKKNLPIDQYLFSETGLNKTDILTAIASILKIGFVDIASIAIDTQALGLVPESISTRHNIIPVGYNAKDDRITIATDDPFNISLFEFLGKKTGKKIVPVLGYGPDIKKTLDTVYSQSLSPEVKEALREVSPQSKQISLERTDLIVKEAPIAKIVNTILEFAVKSRASDIHIEAQETKTRVRYRIDGILHEKLSLPKGIHDALVSRIKILSTMKIDEKRIPQDGRFSFNLGEEEVDLRVSSLPSVHGEKIVMRLLKKTGGLPTLPELGLRGP